MTTQQTTAVERYRRPKGQHPKPRRDPQEKSARQLPEYLEAHEVDALIRAAPNPRARLLFLVEWRAGLRNSEALAVEARDLSLDTDRPTMRVRRGKGQQGQDRAGPCRAACGSHQRPAVRQHRSGRQARQRFKVHVGPVDKDCCLQGRRSWVCHTAWTSHIESHTQAFIRSPSADAAVSQSTTSVTLARALIDPDDADLPGTLVPDPTGSLAAVP